MAQRAYTSLNFAIVPGANSGFGVVYEDDGVTMDYLTGSYSNTNVTYMRPDAHTLVVTISTAGTFQGISPVRSYSITVLNSLPLSSATYTSGTQTTAFSYARLAKPGSWTYDGHMMASTVTAPALDVTQDVTFTLEFIGPIDDALLSGLRGCVRKVCFNCSVYLCSLVSNS